MTNKSRKIAFAGMFIALSIVLTRFFSYMVLIGGVQSIRLSFGEIPLMLSGFILGPIYGAFTGALADLVGFPFNPQGSYFPGFTLTAALSGFLPGLFGKLHRKPWSWLSLMAVVGITVGITSLLLNSLWLTMMFGQAFAVLLPPRAIAAVILTPVYVVVIRLSLKAFSKINLGT